MISPIEGPGPRADATPTPAKSEARAAKQPDSGPAAETTISEAARVANMDATKTKPADELRTERIFALRTKIAAGEYEVDAEEIAARLIEQL